MSRPHAWFAVGLATLIAACSPDARAPHPVAVPPSPLDDLVADETLRAGAPVTRMAGLVPADTDAIGAIDFSSLGPQLEKTFGGATAVAQLRKDLQAIFGRLLGPDLSGAGMMVAWANIDQRAFGLVLHGDFGIGRMKGKKLERVAGLQAVRIADLFMAKIGSVVVAGNRAGLEAMAAVHKRKRKGLTGSPAWGEFESGMKLVRGEAPLFIGSGRRGLLAAVLAQTPLKGADLSRLSFSLGRDFSLRTAIQGSKAARMQVEGLIEMGRKMVRNEALSQRDKALDDDDIFTATVGVMAAHSTLAGLEMLKLSTRDEALVGLIEPPVESTPYLAITGVLAAVAIPAFVKYQRRAKTTEAIDQIDRIYKAAALYYATPRVDRTGRRLPCRFPDSVAPTPTAATCCAALGGPDMDGDNRCDPSPKHWRNKTWSALSFELTEPHYYTYSFDASGVGSNAGMTITANGDLDCDGVESTFQRMGFGDPQSTPGDCSLRGSAAFYVEKETE